MQTAAPSSAARKCMSAERRREVSQELALAERWTESVVLDWMALRSQLFAWLERRGIAYAGTRDALLAAMTMLRSDGAAADLSFVYHVATLAEWDETFEVTADQAAIVRQAFARIRNAMGTADRQTQ